MALTPVQKEYLQIVYRRVRYLDEQLSFGKGAPHARRWSLLEREALAWAIQYIEQANAEKDKLAAQNGGRAVATGPEPPEPEGRPAKRERGRS
jgi:hypothetical protein